MPNRPRPRLRPLLALLLAASCSLDAHAAEPLPQLQGWQVPPAWLTPIAPVQISDHVWQLGTAGITTLLFKTEAGAVLIDGGMPQAAPVILDHLKQIGVAPSDVKLLLHSHAHADHVGSTAALQRATGAVVVSNAESAVLMARGGYNDLHYGDSIVFPPVTATRLLQDREVVQLGSLRLQVWFTPGHTPGSMSWTWTDTRGGKATRMALVDSLTLPGYRLLQSAIYPRIVEEFQRGLAAIREMPCDVLITPHPDISGWQFDKPASPHPEPLSCTAYADRADANMRKQLEAQRAAPNSKAP